MCIRDRFGFGRESSGLSNADLELCHAMIRIPTNADFSSLNIASAVQIICYEISKQYLAREESGVEPDNPESPVTVEQMEYLYRHFQEMLTDIGYLDPEKPRHLMRRIKRLFNRTRQTHPTPVSYTHLTLPTICSV